MDSVVWNIRAIIVQRDNNGYGLTVSGDNPVQVQTIKKDGAADRAGIREGDIIVKVNGTLVEHMNHTEVVNLIRAAGPYVTLTVKSSDLISMPGVGLIGGNGGRAHHIPTNDRVTAPLPVNQEIQQQLQGNKLRTLQAMRDKAQADVERLWKKYEMTQNPRDMMDFEKAQQGLKKIESQMKSSRQSTPNLQMVNNSKLCNTGIGPGSHLLQQTHHRAKSSPDPVAIQKTLSCAEGSRRSDSFNDLSKSSSFNSKSRSSAAWDSVDNSSANNHLSPPGSPPPPYGRSSDNDSSGFGDESHTPSGSINISNLDIFSPKSTLGAFDALNRPSSNPAVDIISMEEDDGLFCGDVALPSVAGKQGPYSSLSKLLEHNAHLAVFINFVIDNRLDPSSLLFYLITGLNAEDGSVKEMKRWCYEIHSTFTAPGAPLLIPNVAENIAAEIDDELVHEADKGEMMRRVFRKARNKAKEEINKQLEEFCNKRIAGLGSMFGPPDSQLDESINDPAKQLKIVETYLLPRLDQFHDDYEKNQEDRTLAIINATATVLIKQFGIRNQQSTNCAIERCASFVSKEKSIKSKLMSKHNKKVIQNGHHLTPQYYVSYTSCNICSKLLWGVGPQGYQCVHCHVNVHRLGCMNMIQDDCLGTGQRKERTNDKFWKIKEKIRPVQDQRRRINAKKNSDEYGGDFDSGDRPLTGSGSSAGNLKGDRRPDTLSEERLENDGLVCDVEEMNSVRHEPKRTTNAVGRSESCKEPQRKQPRERRKHSDPNLTSKSSDVDLDNQRHLSDPNHSGSSSNSSLSARSLDRDSPNTSSIELVTTAHQPYFRRDRDSETPDNLVRHSDNLGEIPPGWDGDSDIEIEQDAPDWTKDVPEEILSRLDRLGKKRQEVLNELFHTERLYVRKLKIMDRLFSRPIRNQQLLSTEMINLLFPNLEEILNIHDQFNASIKKKRTENPLVGDIGPVLLEMFDGERGEQLKHAASTFCARQQIGLELLREKRKRDMKFHAFLTEAESNPVCRRLGIKDMIPTVMQRLTKYPLLFESLCNCTAADSIEYKNLQRALELSKEILCSVNYAKKEAEDEERLSEIQRKLDKSFFEKGVERPDLDLRNFDFTRHKLIHDGYLMWRVQKPKGDRPKSEHQEVLLVLLEEMVVLLLKIDDRYVLKMHNARMPARPIIRLNTLHATRVAADKKALYLISKTLHTPFMFELVCSTAEERNMWLQHITRAADDYKSKQESRRNEVQPIGNIPPSVPDSEDRNKDSSEVAESGGAESNDQVTDTSSGVQPEAGLSTKDPRPPTLDTNSPSTNPATQSPESPETGVAEELKRCDAQIHMAFDEKLKIISKLCHIPPEEDIPKEDSADSSPDSTEKPKDAKELVAACIHQVDQLGRLITTQKLTSENLQLQKDQLGIHKVLNGLLAQLLSEVHRKDEDLELRRQELYRIREQNHGYQARLQAKTKTEHQQASSLVSPVRSPTNSRPNSFVSLSSASDHHDYTHEDETEIVGRAPLKPQLSAPVASSSSNSTSPPSSALPAGDAGSFSTTTTSACDNLTAAKPGESRRILAKDVQRKSSSELAQEEFADALEDWDSGVETNRESTETEVVAPTNEIVSSDQQDVEEEGCSKEKLVEGEISQVPSTNDNESYNVPENGELSGLESTKSMTTTSSAISAENEHNQGLTANSASDDSLINGHQEHIPAGSSKSINNSSGEEISNNGKCNSIEVQDGEAQEKTQQR